MIYTREERIRLAERALVKAAKKRRREVDGAEDEIDRAVDKLLKLEGRKP